MKLLFLWIVVALVVTAIALWFVTTPGIPARPLFMALTLLVFAVPPVGSFWMMYMSIRYEKHPLGMVLLAFVPYAFMWYYLERVRTGKHYSR